ncbi:MAG TPA: hypothetical protein VGK22_18160 [Candidatus Angelobacter sp.]|jgi:hypothetical protein
MMKVQIRYCLIVVFLLISFLSAKALQGSPQEALEELATAEKFEDFVKHLPLSVEQHLAKLPKPERDAFADKVMFTKNLARDGGTLSRSGSSWEMVKKTGGDKEIFTFKNTYTAGDTALVELEITGKNHSQTILIGMRLEADEWRIQQVGQWQKTDLAEEILRTQRRETPTDPEQSADALLRTFNTWIVTYQNTYPSQGFPMSLQALSGQETDPVSLDHAKLLDPSYLKEPVVKFGYEFRYTRLDDAHYQITATPIQPGDGVKSFFTDETAQIHATTESRPANASDPLPD